LPPFEPQIEKITPHFWRSWRVCRIHHAKRIGITRSQDQGLMMTLILPAASATAVTEVTMQAKHPSKRIDMVFTFPKNA
jgi:hypothetical protein